VHKHKLEQADLSNITAILEVARRLGLTTDLDELLDLIVSETRSVLNCERATLFLYDPQTEELFSKIAHGVDQIRIPVKTGIAGACALSRQTINIPDAYADPRFNQNVDRQTGYRTRNLLANPLVGHNNQLVGVLQAVNKHNESFSTKDQWILETLSSQAAVAIQRAHLIEEQKEKLRLENELNLARDIQLGLLPKEAPQIPGYDIAGWNRPADQTGGDCYDFLLADNLNPGFLLADATGHGIAPALIVAELRAILRSLYDTNLPLKDMMVRINNLLCHDLPPDRFVTAFFGLLCPQKHEIRYCSAGQGPLVHVKPDTNIVHTLSASSCPLGIMEGLPFNPPDPIKMDPGDVLLIPADGFFEWANAHEEQFGVARLERFALENAHRSAADIILELRRQVDQFSENTPQKDDLTAIVIKRVKPQ
jgi:phosphoserine phosphatase